MFVVQETSGFGQWRNISRHSERKEAKREAKRLARESKDRKGLRYEYRFVPISE